MAHRIEKNDKQQGVVMGWHGLTEIKSNLSLDDCWLNEWEPMPVVLDLNGKPTKWAVLRCSDNKELFIGAPYNPDTFTPIGNVEFLRMIKDSISGTPHEVVSVGSIRNRGRVFVSIKLNGMEKFKAAGRDFASFLNFGNGHDKSSVLWVNTSNTCTVCDNTFTANLVSVENKATAEADDNLSITKRHTKNVKLRLPELSKLIDRAVGVQAEFQLEMDKLAEVEIGRTDAVDLFAGFVGRNILPAARKDGLSTRSRNTASRLGELFVRGKGNRGETLADAFSAVTDYYTHESSGGDNIQSQIISSDYGAGNDAKRSFWGIVTAPELVVKTRSVGEELLANSKS